MEKVHLSGMSSAETDELSSLATNFFVVEMAWYLVMIYQLHLTGYSLVCEFLAFIVLQHNR